MDASNCTPSWKARHVSTLGKTVLKYAQCRVMNWGFFHKRRAEELQVLCLIHSKQKPPREDWIVFVLRQEGRRRPCDHSIMNSALTFKWFNLLTRIGIATCGSWLNRVKCEITTQDGNNCICLFPFRSPCICFQWGKPIFLIRKSCSFCFSNQFVVFWPMSWVNHFNRIIRMNGAFKFL